METYISTDIESDGPIPGDNSMLSLGAAAFQPDGKMVGTFYATLDTLPGAKGDPDTMKWWDENQVAYDEARKNTRPAQKVMQDYVSWARGVPGKPVFVGYPAGFDFLFVYWYIKHFGLDSPFSFSAVDIKTYAMAVLKKEYRQSTKKNMPGRWFSGTKHTHIAVDDAIEQGELFIAMLKENTK
jgi:DNA polymerase III alpha subunit (gram-positive type)